MKNMLTGSNGTHFTTRVLRSSAVLLIGMGLSFALWTALAPVSMAQGMTPMRMIESNLPQGKTMANSTKPELLSAVCEAVKKNRNSAPQIVRVATEARRAWSNDILRTAFECAGTDANCGLLGRILRAAIAGNPDDASDLTEQAIGLSPNCASAFGGAGAPPSDDLGEGAFGIGPGNQNPPPGSVGGGGGQGNVVAVCLNGRTIFVSPRGAEDVLSREPNATVGPCQVTPSQNQ